MVFRRVRPPFSASRSSSSRRILGPLNGEADSAVSTFRSADRNARSVALMSASNCARSSWNWSLNASSFNWFSLLDLRS